MDKLPSKNKDEIIKLRTETHLFMKEIRDDISELKELFKEFKNDFVTKQEFKPVQKIVYGMTGAILIAFLSSVILLVLK